MTISVPQQGYTKALDIIDAAFRLVRGAESEKPITALDRENGWQTLVWMLDMWSAESCMVPSVTRESFQTVAGQSSYLIGPGGDWHTERPTLIRDMRIQFGGVDMPIKIVGYDDYQAIKLKTLTTDPIREAWPDNGHPAVRLYVYPVPASACAVTLISEKPLAGPLGLRGEVSFAPGYMDALVYGLTIRLAEYYGAQLQPLTIRRAEVAKRQIKANNRRQSTLQIDPALLGIGTGGRYNIYTDGNA